MKRVLDLRKLAHKYGCTLDIADNGRIYLYAPDGMAFRSCQSQAIASGGWSLPHRGLRASLKLSFEHFCTAPVYITNMITYRFNRKWVRAFATEAEAFDHSLSYDDHVQATVERLVNGRWEIFTETYDGNGKWVPVLKSWGSRARVEEAHWQYRGWEIARFDNGRFSISREGHQSYANFKSLEAAQSKIDAIVG